MKYKNKYIKELIKLFYISINSDIEKWSKSGSSGFKGPDIDGFCFSIETFYDEIKVCDNTTHKDKCLIKYKQEVNTWFGDFKIIKNFKINRYVKKLEKHFNDIKKKKSYEDEIYKLSYDKISENYISKIRKEKLKRLK